MGGLSEDVLQANLKHQTTQPLNGHQLWIIGLLRRINALLLWYGKNGLTDEDSSLL